MRELVTVGTLLLALLGPAAAQNEAGKKRAAELLAGLTTTDASLLGQTWLGLHLPSGKNIGSVLLSVEEAPEGSGGAYRVKTEVHMAFGPTRVDRTGTSLLAADLGVRSHTAEERSQEGDEQAVEVTAVSQDGAQWSCEVKQGERSARYRFPVRGPAHQGLASLVLLARKVDLSQPGSYVVQEVDWPDLPAEGAEAPEVVSRDVVIEVPAAAPYEHRGKQVQAYSVSVKRSEETLVIVVDAQHRLLGFGPKDSPVRMIVAGDKAEAGKDLEGQVAKVEPGPKTPVGACALYLLVLAKAKPATDLDQVMDWAAILKWFQANNLVRWKEYDAGQLRDELVGEFKDTETGVTLEQAEQFIGMLKVELKGDRATVTGPGMPPFELVKQEDGLWKIVRFPA